MAALNSDELADISTKDLEEWLKTQEEEAELLRRRVEENELVVRELRKIIAERKSQTATAIDTEDTPDDDSPKRAERSLSPDPNLDISQKRSKQGINAGVDRSVSAEVGPTILERGDGSSPDDDADTPFQRLKKAKIFQPPRKKAHPNELFVMSVRGHPGRRSLPADKLRMIRRSDPENHIIILTSGQFLQRFGTKHERDSAGCAVIYMPKSDGSGRNPDCIGFSIEERGPNGEFFNPNGMRADLRAVVAALEFKVWSSEGWSKVTIATDSNYVYDGITKHIAKWWDEGLLGGKAHNGRTMKNLDLWTRLLDLINEQAYHGCEVAFWRIRPEQNKQARLVAETMAKRGERSEEYRAFGNVKPTYLDD